ncbi:MULTISPECIES: hypothetical protein [unclassified Variovorax]|uniref:hypothetical protein n=1 Tax=unclassified Variovorax TaxID=663243 RepID=UPI00076DCB3F|nr:MULTISPECIES: hypothetical protein [unclassified Variovorax]KWT89347.1 hypothetical protein APY03_3426 [Variovorax sp. WDL1]PNG56524.1 hypothetical protein CHC07_02943 [Variovorax sp. B4]PNG57948.1 hypothetical protein CHC06_02946 [Variovorax sp. B2]VTV09585.1 hypothetical protein WDL1CHR_00680 [Variovorax sp. WDL1]
MKLSSKVASALSFAHLGGLARKSAKASAEGDDPEKKDEDEDKAKAKAEGDDDRKKRDDESDDEYAARMEAMDEDESAEGDDPEKKDDDEDEKPSAKAGDDDKDEEMRGKSAVAQARLREQARCAAIFSHKAAASNPVLAANLAFKTRVSRTEALAVLEATPAAAGAHVNANRAARNPGIAAGNAAAPSGPQATAAGWDRAFAKANPKRK